MSLRRSSTILIFTVALCVLAIKLWLAWKTLGAADASLWDSFAAHINDCGVCVYHTGGLMVYPGGTRVNPFNHPPFIIHFIKFASALSELLGVPLRSILRTITSIADIGSAYLMLCLLQIYGVFSLQRFILYLLAPATIIISGFHGNTDTLMIGFVLLTVYLLIKQSKWAGVAFGVSLCIKIVPIIFVAAFLLYLTDKRTRVRFLIMAALTGLVLSLPYIAIDPITIAKEVLGYGGFAGRWGLSLVMFNSLGPSDGFRLFVKVSSYLLLAYTVWLSYKNRKKDLMVQLGLYSFLFLSFSPAWGSNYLAWLDPFPVLLGVVPALLYYIASGALLIYLYFINDDESTRLMSLCWTSVLIVAWLFLRRLKHENRKAT